MARAEAFRAIRSYLSTTAKHGTLDALTRAASGTPRSLKHQHDKAEEHLSSNSRFASLSGMASGPQQLAQISPICTASGLLELDRTTAQIGGGTVKS
jgi:phage I-like protein